MTRLMELLKELGPRIKVVLTAALTWLFVIQAILLVAAEQIAPLIPAPWSDQVSAFLLTALSVVGVAILAIRRVSPVVPDERGLLPPS